MEGGTSVTLDDVFAKLQTLTKAHEATAARLEELEKENKALRAPTGDEAAAAAAVKQTPKTKTALEQEEAEIHKGMAKMNANNTPWPIPSVATATGIADAAKQLFQGMTTKAQTKPPEIQALTGLLELEGDLVSFISAIAEGTFGNEDVRAMVANGLKSYITAFIANKIVTAEGELMKLVAKNDMPGTATSILGKVKDQIATARTPIAPKGEHKTMSQHISENKDFAKGAVKSKLESHPEMKKHLDAGHAADAAAKAKKTEVAKEAAAKASTTKEGIQAKAHADVADIKAKSDAAAAATKAKADVAKAEATAKAEAAKAAAQAKADAAHEARATEHAAIKDTHAENKAKVASLKAELKQPGVIHSQAKEAELKQQLAQARQDRTRSKAVLSASRKENRTRKYYTKDGIKRSLSSQLAAYKANTAVGRERVAAVASKVGNAMAKSASEAAIAQRLKEKGAEEVGKLERELATAEEELEKLKAATPSPLVDSNKRSKELEVKRLTELLEQKKSEALTQRYGAPTPGI